MEWCEKDIKHISDIITTEQDKVFSDIFTRGLRAKLAAANNKA
mgnify:CR=1 FL=1|tara:strand:- start:1220 stop:1348 length:129 start_codon:yes stop_codon:yes gene_type:complete